MSRAEAKAAQYARKLRLLTLVRTATNLANGQTFVEQLASISPREQSGQATQELPTQQYPPIEAMQVATSKGNLRRVALLAKAAHVAGLTGRELLGQFTAAAYIDSTVARRTADFFSWSMEAYKTAKAQNLRQVAEVYAPDAFFYHRAQAELAIANSVLVAAGKYSLYVKGYELLDAITPSNLPNTLRKLSYNSKPIIAKAATNGINILGKVVKTIVNKIIAYSERETIGTQLFDSLLTQAKDVWAKRQVTSYILSTNKQTT